MRSKLAPILILSLVAGIAFSFFQGKPFGGRQVSEDANWELRLYSPTFLTAVQGLYFIVDCWHGRVLWSDSISASLQSWRSLDKGLHGPHSIVGYGGYYFIDDTEAGAVQVYTRHPEDVYKRVASISGLGKRPHRLRIDERRGQLVVLAANSQELFLVENTPPFQIKERLALTFQEGAYTRSFTIYGDEILFVSGPGKVVVADLNQRPLSPSRSYQVPRSLLSMNDIYFSGRFWYVTATPQQIVRVKRLEDLESLGENTDALYRQLELRGTPYYLHQQGDQIIVPEINEWSGFTSFKEVGDEIADVRHFLEFGPASEASMKRKQLVMAIQ